MARKAFGSGGSTLGRLSGVIYVERERLDLMLKVEHRGSDAEHRKTRFVSYTTHHATSARLLDVAQARRALKALSDLREIEDVSVQTLIRCYQVWGAEAAHAIGAEKLR